MNPLNIYIYHYYKFILLSVPFYDACINSLGGGQSGTWPNVNLGLWNALIIDSSKSPTVTIVSVLVDCEAAGAVVIDGPIGVTAVDFGGLLADCSNRVFVEAAAGATAAARPPNKAEVFGFAWELVFWPNKLDVFVVVVVVGVAPAMESGPFGSVVDVAVLFCKLLNGDAPTGLPNVEAPNAELVHYPEIIYANV